MKTCNQKLTELCESRNIDGYVGTYFESDKTIILDGEFSREDLLLIAKAMEYGEETQ